MLSPRRTWLRRRGDEIGISLAEGDFLVSYVIFSKDSPNESRQLSCYCHSCFAWHFALINESPVTSSQTSAGVVGDVYCPLRLAFSSFFECGGYAMRMSVVPGGLLTELWLVCFRPLLLVLCFVFHRWMILMESDRGSWQAHLVWRSGRIGIFR